MLQDKFSWLQYDHMARPPKDESDRRTNVLRIRLTSKERKKLDDAAMATGLDTSTWARYELLGRSAKVLTKRPSSHLA